MCVRWSALALKHQSETSDQWRERWTDVSPSGFVLKLKEGSWVRTCSSHPDCRWKIHEQNRSSSPPLSPVQTASYPPLRFPHLPLLHFLHVFRWRSSHAECRGSTDDCVLNCSESSKPCSVAPLLMFCSWISWRVFGFIDCVRRAFIHQQQRAGIEMQLSLALKPAENASDFGDDQRNGMPL